MPLEFDEHMQQRLRAFQELHGLTTDGVAGGQTWNKLMSAQPAATPSHTNDAPQQQAYHIPLSDYPHLQALFDAESADVWLASLGIHPETESEALA